MSSAAIDSLIMSNPADGSYVPPQVVTLCSIYPLPLTVRRPQFNKNFVIKAGTRTEPFYLPIGDCEQSVYHGQDIGTRRTRILASHVAEDVINEAVNHLHGSNPQEDAYPGIFICSQGSKATEEELTLWGGKQRRFMIKAVDEARELDRLKQNSRIWDKHHLAAKILGLKSESWQRQLDKEAQVECENCFLFVDARAKICPHCRQWTKPEYAAAAVSTDRPAAASPEAGPALPPTTLKPPLTPPGSKQ